MSPYRVAAPPSPKEAGRKRRHRLAALRDKGASRTPAENGELLNLLADAVAHMLKDDEED
jgi:hypothetical protein